MMSNRFIFLFIVMTFLFFTTVELCYSKELTIVYTANTGGKLRECGCPNDPYGGLSERASLLKIMRSKETEPFLLVDAGNMVSLFGPYESKAGYVIRLMNLMGYDAAGIGCQELFYGIQPALMMEKNAKFPFISSTISDSTNNKLLFKPYIISKVNGLKVGILCVCDSTGLTKIGPPKKKDFSFINVTDMLKKNIGEIRSKCDYIILLSHLSDEQNKSISKQFPEINLIIEAYNNKKIESPVNTGDGLIVSPGSHGQFLGIITIDKSKNGKTNLKSHSFIPVLDIQEDKEAHKIVMEYYK
jgi:S-sulfosulfanyl-L-cysteine sulfohydrolase